MWPLNKTLEARVDGIDLRALRRIENIHWSQHVSNQELRLRTQQPPASIFAAKKRLRWYGHGQRMPDEHPTKMVADFDPRTAGWARPRGAPRTRWSDTIAKDLHQLGLSLEDAYPITQNRNQWRNLVDLFGSTRLPALED